MWCPAPVVAVARLVPWQPYHPFGAGINVYSLHGFWGRNQCVLLAWLLGTGTASYGQPTPAATIDTPGLLSAHTHLRVQGLWLLAGFHRHWETAVCCSLSIQRVAGFVSTNTSPHCLSSFVARLNTLKTGLLSLPLSGCHT